MFSSSTFWGAHPNCKSSSNNHIFKTIGGFIFTDPLHHIITVTIYVFPPSALGLQRQLILPVCIVAYADNHFVFCILNNYNNLSSGKGVGNYFFSPSSTPIFKRFFADKVIPNHYKKAC